MSQPEKQNLKEIRSHGTSLFPCAFYLALGSAVRLKVKHHWHDELEIIYLKKGKFNVSIDTEHFEVDQECFLFINAGQLHDIHSISQDYEEQAIVFNPQMLRFQNYDSIDEYILHPLVQGTLTFPRILDSSHPVFPLFCTEYKRISSAFCRNQQVTITGEQIYTHDMTAQMQIKASLLQILALLTSQNLMCQTRKPENQKIESLKTVLTHISLHYQEKLYIHDLASLVNMNEQYFCRFFKKAIGKSPIDYLNDFRLTKVIRLLESTELPVTEIYLECVFHNLVNFQRLFKRKTGTTPLQYRKMLSSKSQNNVLFHQINGSIFPDTCV